jgi:hypothetical protein
VQLRKAARNHVIANYDRNKNLAAFADTFLHRIRTKTEKSPYENSVLQ